MAATPSSPARPSKRLKMSSSSATTSDADDEPSAAPASGEVPRRRYKRRKVAIFLGYCGAGYQGMQKNPGARTIEGELEEALFLSGAVPEADRCLPHRYDWARSARTDKGVSAAAQVVSGRFYVDPPGFVARLNSHLPDQIRIFGYKRVTTSFNAKKFCDRRRYVYLLPVFALDPSAHPDREAVMASVGSGNELARCLECSERGRKVPSLMGPSSSDGTDEAAAGATNVHSENGRNIVDIAEIVTVKVVRSCLTGDESGDQKCASNVDLTSETRRNQVGNAEFVSVKVGIDGGEVGISTLNLETQRSVDEGRIGSGSSEIVAKKDNVFPAANANQDSAGEFGAPGVQEVSKIKNEDIVKDKKVPTDEEVSLEKLGLSPIDVEASANKEQVAARSAFCYGDKEKERFNKILKHYVGTHNFHNFTTRTKAEDPSAKRYIISFDAHRVISLGGIDFVRCEVVGQSFMLHQIRKLMGLAVAVMRNCAPESLIDVALQKNVNINVPTAPEVGLYLDECLFSSYNKKWKDSHEALTMEAYAEEAEEFRVKYIFSHIASMEHKEGAFALWLHSLNHRNYPDFRLMETIGEGPNEAKSEMEGAGV